MPPPGAFQKSRKAGIEVTFNGVFLAKEIPNMRAGSAAQQDPRNSHMPEFISPESTRGLASQGSRVVHRHWLGPGSNFRTSLLFLLGREMGHCPPDCTVENCYPGFYREQGPGEVYGWWGSNSILNPAAFNGSGRVPPRLGKAAEIPLTGPDC